MNEYTAWNGGTRWQLFGVCRERDHGWFFPPNHLETRDEKREREAKAKAMCARCPVRSPCLDFALRTREGFGVWGGLNEAERRALLRRLPPSQERSA